MSAHPSRIPVDAATVPAAAIGIAVAIMLAGLVLPARPLPAEATSPAPAAQEKTADAKETGEKKTAAKKNDAKKPPAERPAAEKPEGKKPDAPAKESAPSPEKELPPPVFHLRDGTRITGFPQMKQITIDTPYGRLVVPTKDIVRVRFAREEDPALQERIRSEIDRLADEEFEVREQAMANLLEIGPAALKQLRKALQSDDEEVKSRAQTLVTQLEEAAEEEEEPDDDEDEVTRPISGEDDELMTLRFTAKGKILERVFEVQSSYGPLVVKRDSIIGIVFQEYTPSQVELSVPGTYFAGAGNWYQTRISLKKNEEISIAASGQILLQNYGYGTGPDGTTRTSTKHFQNFKLGALVARVGKKGKPFLVGQKFRGKSPGEGKLMFAVAVRSGTVSGAFTVKIDLPEK